MAKRFTDTAKYKKGFIRGLPGPYKLLWDFLYHDCDHAGVWIVDFQIAQTYLGKDMKVNKADALKFFNADEKRIVELNGGSKWFIPSFIEFQYGKLSEKNRAHINVIIVLKKHNLLNSDLSLKGLASPLQGAKEQEQEKEQEKEIEGGKGETLRGELTYDAEKTILANQIRLEQLCMTTQMPEPTARDALRNYHLWLSENEKYPKSKKSVFDGFEKWLRNEKKFTKNGTHKKQPTGGRGSAGRNIALEDLQRDIQLTAQRARDA